MPAKQTWNQPLAGRRKFNRLARRSRSNRFQNARSFRGLNRLSSSSRDNKARCFELRAEVRLAVGRMDFTIRDYTPVHKCLALFAFRYDQRDVVVLLVGAEVLYVGEDRLKQIPGGSVAVAAQRID